jgi:hypothetical protein
MSDDANDPKGTDDLSNKGIDYVVSALRSATGLFPLGGSFLAELLTIAIPNQRTERIVDYLRILAKHFAIFQKSFLDEQAKRSDFCELVEESFHQAARSTTEERREYIANLIANGLRKDQKDYLQSRFLLRILGQLNDAEILILYYYGLGYSPEANEFEAEHAELVPYWPQWSNNAEQPETRAIRQGYHHHLADMGLLNREYETERHGIQPDLADPRSALESLAKPGQVKLKRLTISDLGQVLLLFVLDSEDPRLRIHCGAEAIKRSAV